MSERRPSARWCGAVLLALAPAAQAVDASLVGRWIWRLPYLNSEMVLAADGRGSFDGDPLAWEAGAGRLHLHLQGQRLEYRYRFHQGALMLTGGDIDGEALLQPATVE